MSDARNEKRPPLLRWAEYGDEGEQGYGVSVSGDISAALITDMWNPEKASRNMRRPAVLAEPLDIDALVEEIVGCCYFGGGPEGKATIRELLEERL